MIPTSSDLETRHLVAAFGDQLDAKSAASDGFEAGRPAMRYFRQDLAECGYRLHDVMLDDPDNRGSFAAEIEPDARDLPIIDPRELQAGS